MYNNFNYQKILFSKKRANKKLNLFFYKKILKNIKKYFL